MTAPVGVPLDAAACYQALQARDPRFDGRFFVAVTSTRIYCRPVCTVRVPRAANCNFFRSAAEAETHGYRPCLRCRPELAPGFAIVDASAALARRAAALIQQGEGDGDGVASLAARLGITDRHLRRVFVAHYGVTPVGYLQTQRLLLAKRLLADTAMPVTEVAMASGFGSLRRFNAMFAARYRMAPTRLRSQAAGPAPDAGLCLELAYRPPLQWDAMLEFLAARVIAGVEQVSAGCYRRIIQACVRGQTIHGWIEVSHRPERRTLLLRIDPGLRHAVAPLLGAVRRLFDLDARPDDIARVLGPLAQQEPGLRMPGAIDGFELAVRAILGQQVSVKAAHTLAGRVARRFGTPVDTGIDGLELAFAQPAAIAAAQTTDLSALGIVSQRGAAIIGLARAVCDGVVRLAPDADVQTQVSALCAIPGIGDWTAQYIAMRALGWPDAFPAADLVLMRALGVRTPAQARAASAHWSPWRSYAVMHLWRNQARAAMMASKVRAAG